MEFGIHDDYIPDYGLIYGLKQPFYLFDPCEENYKYVFFITEFGSFITSFFLFIPHIYVNILFPKKFLPETHQIAKNLMFSGVASLFYHGYVSYLTQFMDMLTIMWTLMHVIEYLNIPFTQKQQYIIIQMFFFGMFHPLLTAFTMLYLIFKVAGYILKKGYAIGRYIVFTPVILILISFSMIILDIILCPYQIFRYFHAIWHITAFMAFCFLIMEVEFNLRNRNK